MRCPRATPPGDTRTPPNQATLASPPRNTRRCAAPRTPYAKYTVLHLSFWFPPGKPKHFPVIFKVEEFQRVAEKMRHIFTSESVTEGHPDKMADQISDAVLDAVLRDDPMGRVACEVLLTTGICVVSGEITTTTYVDVPKLARKVIEDLGYNTGRSGFDWQ